MLSGCTLSRDLNIFLTKDAEKTMMYPEFSLNGIYYEDNKNQLAPFKTLQKLYTYETDCLLKYSYKLSFNSLSISFRKAECRIGLAYF